MHEDNDEGVQNSLWGVLEEMEKEGMSAEFVDSVRDSFDCTLYFFDNKVEVGTMYAVICTTVVLLIALYVLMNILREKKRAK